MDNEDIIKDLLCKVEEISTKLSALKVCLFNIPDGYYYRVSYSVRNKHWDEYYANRYAATDSALHYRGGGDNIRDGVARLFTNNPMLLKDDSIDWGEIDIKYEEPDQKYKARW